MLQSIAKGAAAAKTTEARPATEVFVTEPLNPHTITVGDAAHKNARRAHDATLVGLAPPPPVHFSSLNTQPLALPQEPQQPASTRDERRLATILVLGTLIAMFAIAFSAVPGREPTAAPAALQRSEAIKTAQPTPKTVTTAQALTPVVAGVAKPASVAQPKTVAPNVEPQTALPKAAKPATVRPAGLRVRAINKTDAKTSARRRVKPSVN